MNDGPFDDVELHPYTDDERLVMTFTTADEQAALSFGDALRLATMRSTPLWDEAIVESTDPGWLPRNPRNTLYPSDVTFDE